MSTLHNNIFCSILIILSSILVMLATWLLRGEWGFNFIQEALTLLLLLWLISGSKLAKWITGILSFLAAMIVFGGIAWILISHEHGASFITEKTLSFCAISIAAVLHVLVFWRLLILKTNNNSEQAAISPLTH